MSLQCQDKLSSQGTISIWLMTREEIEQRMDDLARKYR